MPPKRQKIEYKTLYERTKLQEPQGWDFQAIRFWEYLNPNWWFIPWEMIELLPSNAAPPPRSSGGRRKLLIQQINPINKEHTGSGIVIDGITFRIVGCYKLFKNADSNTATTQASITRKREHMRTKPAELQKLQAIPWRRRTKKQRENILKLRPKVCAYYYPLKIRRLNGLLLDSRPYQVALHTVGRVWEISSAMNREELRQYGKRYATLFEEWKAAMGQVFNEGRDVPAFYQ